jgi:hypothetical protein
VHLAVHARAAAVRVEDDGGIVVQAGGALFEERDHQHDGLVPRQIGQGLQGGILQLLGQIEMPRVLLDAEVVREDQFGQDHHLGPLGGGMRDAFLELGEALGVEVVPLGLEQGEFEGGHGR